MGTNYVGYYSPVLNKITCGFRIDNTEWGTKSYQNITMGDPIINTWVHRAVTRKNNIIYAFQNGILYNAFTLPDNFIIPENTNEACLGSTKNSTDDSGIIQWYKGYIDDFMILRGKAIWTSNFDVPTTYLYKYFYFDNSNYAYGYK